MKSRLLIMVLAGLFLCGTAAFGQGDPNDPGIKDTVDLELTVDTIGLTAKVELWVFNDQTIEGASMGFSWLDSENPGNFVLDTAYETPFIAASFDLGRFFYEAFSLPTTNANKRFLFGGALLFSSGVAPDATGRRLWATYEFTLSSWGGFANDAFVVDTLQFDAGSEYLFAITGTSFKPVFTGAVTFGGAGTAVGEPSDILPTSYALKQNYPNPFNPSTEIAFDLPSKSKVRLAVYNILGQEVTTLVNKDMVAGQHTVQWDGSGQASGVYFYKIEAGDYSQTRKMILVK